MRDFHALLLLILVLGTSLSGLLVHIHVELTADKDHHSGGRDIYELGWSYVLLDTASALSTVLGMLGLILMLVMSHILYHHGNVITEQELEERLRQFGEKYKGRIKKLNLKFMRHNYGDKIGRLGGMSNFFHTGLSTT